MKKYIIFIYIIILIVVLMSFINPYYDAYFTHVYDGGDISIYHLELSIILLVISVGGVIVHKREREAWLLSIGLAIFNVLVINPLIFFYVFFGLPFVN